MAVVAVQVLARCPEHSLVQRQAPRFSLSTCLTNVYNPMEHVIQLQRWRLPCCWWLGREDS